MVRALVARPHLAAALLLASIVLVYLWPALVGGDMLAPISVLYTFTPWQGFTPADIQSYYNPLLSDIPMADYPWRWFVREQIRDGVLPLWNPHVFAGIPFLSNPQNGLFTPFNIPLWVLPLNYALGLSAAIKLWAGGFGAYLLVRQLRLGFLAGLLAGVTFAFCSLNITWLTHETLPAVAILMPWMLWLVERIFERGRLATMLWLAVATAIGLGGGHPGMQVHLMALTGLYALVRVWLVPDLARADRVRRLAYALGGLTLGALLMAVMLLPEILSSRDTLGTQARQGGRGTLPGTIMPFDAIKTVLFPDWWGRPSSIELPSSAESVSAMVNYNERTFYGGVVALLLGLVALVSPGGWRRKAPFALLAFLGLAVPLHLPGLWWIVTHLPAFELVQNQRMHFVFELGVAVLAAFGLQAVLDRPTEERWRLLVPGTALLGALVAFIAIGPSGSDVGDLWEHFVSGTSFAVREVLALTSVTWFALFALGVAAALLAAIRWPQHRVAIAAAVVVLAVADMLHFATGYQPMGPADRVIPPRTPAIEYLQARAGDGRFFGLGYAVTNDWSTVYGLHDVRGYDPPNPTRRLYDLWRIGNPLQADWTPFTMEGLSPQALKVVSVLGARYIVADPGVGTPDRDVARFVRPVYEGADATIFLNSAAVPRTFVAPRVEVTEDEDQTRATLAHEDFSLTDAVVVERGERGAAGLAEAGQVRGRASVIAEENASVTLRATLDRRGLVVLNDSYMPGWSVRVDGREADPVRVNSVMRGVVVGPGTHEIEWSYAMPGLRLGALVSLVSFLAIAGTAVVLVARKRRGCGIDESGEPES